MTAIQFYMDESKRRIYYKRMIDLYAKMAREAQKNDDQGSYKHFIGKVGDYQRSLDELSAVV
jgi:hypothetical protein